MRMLRFSVLGLIAAAALCLMTPVSFIDWRSWVIFAVVCVLTLLPQFLKTPEFNDYSTKNSTIFVNTALNILSHPIILIVLAGIAGYAIYGQG